MIIRYEKKYENEAKELLYELQEYIEEIDKEKYNVILEEYKDIYFNDVMNEVEKYQGTIMLYKENERIVGLVIGCINNEETDDYSFKAPKRGRINELIVSKTCRGKGYGQILLNKMEEYLKSLGCEDILIGVFAYNETACQFYEKNGYHLRMCEYTKTNI